jgi:hypothetical protein
MQAININTKPDKTAESHLNPITKFSVNTMQNARYLYKSTIFQKLQMRFDIWSKLMVDSYELDSISFNLLLRA